MTTKYISETSEGIYWVWDYQEDAEDNFLNELEPGETVIIYEVEVEPASLNDANVLVVYDGCGAQFFENPKKRDEENDDMVEEVYKIKCCPHSWEFKLEITTYINNRPELPF